MLRDCLRCPALYIGLTLLTGCARDPAFEQRDRAIAAINARDWGALFELASKREKMLLNLTKQQFEQFCEAVEIGDFKITGFKRKIEPDEKSYRIGWILSVKFRTGIEASVELKERKDSDGNWYIDVSYLPIFLNAMGDPNRQARHTRILKAIDLVGLTQYHIMYPEIILNKKYFESHR